jgi:hypothetical protein
MALEKFQSVSMFSRDDEQDTVISDEEVHKKASKKKYLLQTLFILRLKKDTGTFN